MAEDTVAIRCTRRFWIAVGLLAIAAIVVYVAVVGGG